jgi:hypothetical protein
MRASVGSRAYFLSGFYVDCTATVELLNIFSLLGL